MLEEILVHKTRASDLVIVELLTLGPIFAVVVCWPSEANWKFFGASEWAEAATYYKNKVQDEIDDNTRYELEMKMSMEEFEKTHAEES
jgi:hypothetical protein